MKFLVKPTGNRKNFDIREGISCGSQCVAKCGNLARCFCLTK